MKRASRAAVAVFLMSFVLSGSCGPGLRYVESADFGMSADFLISTGINFFDQGRYAEAMKEFKKALLIDPDSVVAKEFLKEIEVALVPQRQAASFSAQPSTGLAGSSSREVLMGKALDEFEPVSRQPLKSASGVAQPLTIKQPFTSSAAPLATGQQKSTLLVEPEQKTFAQALSPKKIINVNSQEVQDQIKENQPRSLVFELELGDALQVQFGTIKRVLNTTPQIIDVAQKEQNSVIVIGKEVGSGIFLVWDDNGRWSMNVNTKPKQFVWTGGFAQELSERSGPVGLSETFKFTYSLDWGAFRTGRGVRDTHRTSLSFNQSFGLRGETPYGLYDSYFTVDRIAEHQYEIDNLSMGLTDAHFLGLSHMNIRLFDFSTGVGAFKFPNADLRGARVDSPLFTRMSYSAFWGGIPQGTYTRLQAGLGQTQEAYLEGIRTIYDLTDNARFSAFYAQSYGEDLNKPIYSKKIYGLGSYYRIGKVFFTAEAADDGRDNISYTSSLNLSLAKSRYSLTFTEDNKNFNSVFGGEPSGGSTSVNLSTNYTPASNVNIANSLVTRRDRRLFNPDHPSRWNYVYDTTTFWTLDPHTSVEIGYNRDDQQGTISPTLIQTKHAGFRREVFFFKRLSTYVDLSNSISKDYTTASANYDRNTLRGGFSMNLVRDVTLTMNESINFIERRDTREHAHPHAMEITLNYYSRILTSPFYGRLRVSYRDEEATESAISFLSGEDRLEFQGELDYKPYPGFDSYVSLRAANIWAEKEGNPKHFDAEIRYGLRWTWDTGFRWNTKGNVAGYVFEDINADNIKSRNEKGLSGVVIKTNTEQTATTDKNGHYKISNIVGKKARISIDMGTIPRGYILTTPSSYDVVNNHGETKTVNFGLTTRAEIVGIVFFDENGNGKFDREESGLSGVVLIVDDKEKTVSDENGQYLVRKLSTGEHTIKIDLSTIPSQYLPKVPVKRKVILEKGMTFYYNIPLMQSVKQSSE